MVSVALRTRVLRIRCRGGLAAALQRALGRYAFKTGVLECAAPTSANRGSRT